MGFFVFLWTRLRVETSLEQYVCQISSLAGKIVTMKTSTPACRHGHDQMKREAQER
jgi:hypothetical protein